jgi:hypothetical protein
LNARIQIRSLSFEWLTLSIERYTDNIPTIFIPRSTPPHNTHNDHYRNPWLCRERVALGTGRNTLGTACAERELSAKPTWHRWAGKWLFAESQSKYSRHKHAESPIWLSTKEIFQKQKNTQGSPWTPPTDRRRDPASWPPPRPPPPPPEPLAPPSGRCTPPPPRKQNTHKEGGK